MRVAVIGLGYWGPNLVLNLAASPVTELVAVCDRDDARAKTVGAQSPSARQLTDAEAVFTADDVDAGCGRQQGRPATSQARLRELEET